MEKITKVRNIRDGERYSYSAQGYYVTQDNKKFSLSGPCAAMIAHLANLDTVEDQFNFFCFSILWESWGKIHEGILYGKESPVATRYAKLREQVTENPWMGSAKYVVPMDTSAYETELFNADGDLRLETVEKMFVELGKCEYILYGYILKNEKDLRHELLDLLRGLDPLVFEVVVAELLEKMGYGQYSLTSKSMDSGVDIVFSEDPLGIHKVYVQVKRYAKNAQVTRREMQNFIGALDILGADKGIFVTTSKYYRDAYIVHDNAMQNIALINGEQLCSLMIDYQIGIKQVSQEDVQIDQDYFIKLTSLSQKRLSPVIGRSSIWAELDPEIYQRAMGSFLAEKD